MKCNIKSLQPLPTPTRSHNNALSPLSNSVHVQFCASFLLALDPLQQMPLQSLVDGMKIFEYIRFIFQLLMETPCNF